MKIASCCVLLVSSTSANADIIRVYEQDGMEKDVELSRQTKLNRNQYNRSYVNIVSYDDVNRCVKENDYQYTLSDVGAYATKIELLTPETVGVELDMPQSVPVLEQNGFSQKFTGRVFLNKDSDTEKIIEGRLIVVCENSWSTYANTVFSGESDNIVVTKRTLDGESYRPIDIYYLDYILGADNGSEAVFSVELGSGSKSCIIRNSTSANSFDDLIPVYVCRTNAVITNKRDLVAKMLDLPSTASVSTICSEFECNPYVMKYGASTELKITGLQVNGRQIASKSWTDYVTCQPELKICEGVVPAVQVEFKSEFLDEDATSAVVADIAYSQIKLADGAPEWLENFCKHSEGSTFSVSMNYIQTKDRLTPKSVIFPDCEESEGSVEALFDGESSTFCHSSWTQTKERSEPYASYLDVEFEESIHEIGFLMQARIHSNPMYPKEIHLYTSNDGRSWEKLGEARIRKQYASGGVIGEYVSADSRFKTDKPFKYLRWCVMQNKAGQTLILPGTNRYWNLAELRFYGK